MDDDLLYVERRVGVMSVINFIAACIVTGVVLTEVVISLFIDGIIGLFVSMPIVLILYGYTFAVIYYKKLKGIAFYKNSFMLNTAIQSDFKNYDNNFFNKYSLNDYYKKRFNYTNIAGYVKREDELILKIIFFRDIYTCISIKKNIQTVESILIRKSIPLIYEIPEATTSFEYKNKNGDKLNVFLSDLIKSQLSTFDPKLIIAWSDEVFILFYDNFIYLQNSGGPRYDNICGFVEYSDISSYEIRGKNISFYLNNKGFIIRHTQYYIYEESELSQIEEILNSHQVTRKFN